MKQFIRTILNLLFIDLCISLNNEINDDSYKDSQLPIECGQNNVNRIVGGAVAKPHSWPWAVAVYERTYWSQSDNDVAFICGGSIINRRYILCAAHCVMNGDAVGNATNFKMLLGAHNRKKSGKWAKVDKILVHAKYNDQTMQNDIALFRLKEPVNFTKANRKIAPICLANTSMNKEDLSGKSSVVIGWGSTQSMGDISDVLMQVSVPIVPKKICIQAYDKQSITDKNLCAGLKEGSKDSCQGDSGGPLAVRRNNSWIQIGITSWGRGCADKDAYGVYTRVSSHYQWLIKMISKDVKSDSKQVESDEEYR